MMNIKEVFLLWFINKKFFDKKSASLVNKSTTFTGMKNETKQNEQLAEELHKPIVTKFKKRKVCSSFKDNIWGLALF